ncbi:MAG: hypothetical protein RLZZ330_507 [Actinomycetota bacterium]|jgi:hypothetical protein
MVKKFFLGLVMMLTASLTLSSCAQVENAGAAAIVEGKEISISTVTQQYQEIITDLDGGLKPGTDKSMTRAIVGAYIVNELVALAARELGVEVSEATAQAMERNYISSFGGRKEFIKTAAGSGIARSAIRQNVYTSANFEAIGLALDPTGDTNTQSDAAISFLLDYLKHVEIEVNPRFGEWNAQTFALVNTASEATITWKQLKLVLAK